MQIEVNRHDDIVIVAPLETRLDASLTTPFKVAVLAEIANLRPRLILDLNHVDFVDSSGLGAILSIFKHLGADHSMVICSVRPEVMQLFRLTRLNRIFDIVPSRSEALTRLKGAGVAIDAAP